MTTRRSTRHRQTTVEVLVFLDGVLDLTRKDGQHVGLHGGERAIGTLAVADALRIQVEDVAGQQRPFSIAQHTKKKQDKNVQFQFRSYFLLIHGQFDELTSSHVALTGFNWV